MWVYCKERQQHRKVEKLEADRQAITQRRQKHTDSDIHGGERERDGSIGRNNGMHEVC